MNHTQTFKSERSAARMAQIMAMLGERAATGNTFTTGDIMDVTKLGSSAASLYMRHLVAIGIAELVVPAEFIYRGAAPAQYAPALGNVADVDDFPRRVTVRSSWAPNHVRGPMECLLFGVPAAMRERRA